MILKTEHDIIMNQLAQGQPVGYLQAWPRIRTQGYPETNPGSCQSGTLTWDRRIVTTTRSTLGHATLYILKN